MKSFKIYFKKFKKYFLLSVLTFFVVSPQFAQGNIDSLALVNDSVNKRLVSVALAEGVFVVSAYTAFYYLWYKDFKKSSFHFFNDGQEWMGIDKLGHSCASYWLSNLNTQVFNWSGLDRKKSAIYGTVSSFLFMSTIEIFDGYSAEWGASGWDLAANASGATLFLVQELAFEKQPLMLKYSYYQSEYSKYRPVILGSNLGEKMLKDYNATKFWLSFNLNTFINHRIPSWLNVAVGYGATGMTGGFENYISPVSNYKIVPDSERGREFYLSTDIDLSKIKVKSKFLKGLFYTLNFIKIPGPTLGYSKNGWMFGIR